MPAIRAGRNSTPSTVTHNTANDNSVDGIAVGQKSLKVEHRCEGCGVAFRFVREPII